MKAVMVKHKKGGKTYWFAVPERLNGLVDPGVRVICDTARGRKAGVAVSPPMETDDIKDVMAASGARFPLREIVDAAKEIYIEEIKIPAYMARSTPSDAKLARRFLEHYHTRRFQTPIVIDEDCNLLDGYTAYLVARELQADFLSVIVKRRDGAAGEG